MNEEIQELEAEEIEMTVKKPQIIPAGEYIFTISDVKIRPVTSKGKTYTYIDYHLSIDKLPQATPRTIGFYADLGMGTKHYKFISQFVKLEEGKTYKPSELLALVKGMKVKGYVKHEPSKKDPQTKYAILVPGTVEKYDMPITSE